MTRISHLLPAAIAASLSLSACAAAQAGNDRNSGTKRKARFIVAPDMGALAAQQVPNRQRTR